MITNCKHQTYWKSNMNKDGGPFLENTHHFCYYWTTFEENQRLSACLVADWCFCHFLAPLSGEATRSGAFGIPWCRRRCRCHRCHCCLRRRRWCQQFLWIATSPTIMMQSFWNFSHISSRCRLRLKYEDFWKYWFLNFWQIFFNWGEQFL